MSHQRIYLHSGIAVNGEKFEDIQKVVLPNVSKLKNSIINKIKETKHSFLQKKTVKKKENVFAITSYIRHVLLPRLMAHVVK